MRNTKRLASLLLLLAACGEPIPPASAVPDGTRRTLPVVSSPRGFDVGDAFRVSIVIRRAASGITTTTRYVDVVTAVDAGSIRTMDRHSANGRVERSLAPGADRDDFSVFEGLLPRRGGDVPEAWRVEGVMGGLRHGSALLDLPAAGGSADCRIDSVQVRQGHARAVIDVAYHAETPKGSLALTGRIEYDLKEKLLVLAELDGTLGDEQITIRASRSPTNFVPPAADAAQGD